MIDAREQRRRGARASATTPRTSKLDIITEYRAEPGARALEITTTYTTAAPRRCAALPVGDAIQWGARASASSPRRASPSRRRPPRELTTPEGWLIGVAPNVSYGYVVKAR